MFGLIGGYHRHGGTHCPPSGQVNQSSGHSLVSFVASQIIGGSVVEISVVGSVVGFIVDESSAVPVGTTSVPPGLIVAGYPTSGRPVVEAPTFKFTLMLTL